MVQTDVIAISSVQKKRLFSVKNVSLSVIKPVDNVWDTSIQFGMHLDGWESTQQLEIFSAAPRAYLRLPSCSPNYPRAFRIGWTHARHCPFLKKKKTINNNFRCSSSNFWFILCLNPQTDHDNLNVDRNQIKSSMTKTPYAIGHYGYNYLAKLDFQLQCVESK